MAAVYDSSITGGSVTGASSLTFAFDNVSGNALVVACGNEWFGVNCSGITYNSVALTVDRNANYNTFYGYAGGHLFSPATGSHNVVITLTGAGDRLSAGVVSVADADTVSLDDFQYTLYTAGTSPATRVVTSQTDGLVVGALVGRNFDEWTTTSPGTTRVNNTVSNDSIIMLSTWDGASSVTVSFTNTFGAGPAAVMGWAFKPASGSAITGTGAATGPAATSSGAGVVHRTGTGAATVAAATASGAGVVHRTGSGALTSPAATTAGEGTVNGAVQNITGTGALTSPSATSSGAGTRGVLDVGGAVALTGPVATLSGSGTVNGAAQSITGTGALTAPRATMSGAGVARHTGTGALAITAAQIAGSGIAGRNVPDVVGEVQATGTATLEGVGFTVAVQLQFSSTVAVGVIISQLPAAGADAAIGSTVTIRVSRGEAPVGRKYVNGTLVDSIGRMVTIWLGTDPLPAGSKVIEGLAHDAAGRRYLASGPIAKHLQGLAVRSDGVQVAATSGQASAVSGLPVNGEGAIVVSVGSPTRTIEGFGLDSTGLCVTDVS